MDKTKLIKELRDEANRMLQAANLLEGKPEVEQTASTFYSEIKKHIPEKSAGSPNRKQQIIDLLRQRGPLRAKDVMAITGIPRGTATAILSIKQGFKSDGDGRWSLQDN